MGQIRTLGLSLAVKGTPTPAVLAAAYYTSSNLATSGVVAAVASYSITNNIATVVLQAALPTDGFNGPNGYIPVPTASPASATQSQNAVTGQPFDIHGGVAPGPSGTGQKVILWGFGTGTYFNGKIVTVIDNNPAANSFRFAFKNANVGSTADTAGLAAPAPKQHYRAIRLECAQDLGTDLIYVGDLNVSSTQYMACLSLAGQLSIEIASDNIPPEGLFIDTNGSASTDHVMVTVIM